MEHKNINVKLKVWRQKNSNDKGSFETYDAKNISQEMSFLEMFDVLNEELIGEGKDPIAFDHDCREGICGTCGLVINGHAHGPLPKIATCQLHMRNFKDGETIWVEPFRAKAFPVIKDLMVDRSGFDKILQAGGYVSVNTGGVPDANSIPIQKEISSLAMDAAACIGCGACVASCKNASAMLFVAAKVSHLGMLPQGQPERTARVRKMVSQMDDEGFGACTNQYECEAACPKEISADFIARMNGDYLWASVAPEE